MFKWIEELNKKFDELDEKVADFIEDLTPKD